MSKRVDFFIQPDHFEQTFHTFGCHVIAFLFDQTIRPMVVLCTNDDVAKQLDQSLWLFSPHRLIPHDHSNLSQTKTPIRITTQHPESIHSDVLVVNYNNSVFDSTASHVAEIISNQESDKLSARQRYRSYQTSQSTIETHTDVREIIPA